MSEPPVLLHLMRHGAPTLTGRMLGRTDSPMTAEGIAACVSRAGGLDIAAIGSSDLVRATACAQAIASPRGLAVSVDPNWRELDFGTWDGLAPAQIDAAALARFWDDPDRHPPPEGESWSALLVRVAAAIASVHEPTLVVTHGGAMRAAVAVLCRFELRHAWALDLPYASLLSLRLWRDGSPSAQIVGLRT